jgi:hypothetical protein
VAGRFDTDPSLSVYGELGLGRGFTAGLELDWGSSSRMGTVFARYTLTSSSAPLQLAVDGGFAMRSVDDRPTETLLRVGGSLGGSFGGATAPGDRGPAVFRGRLDGHRRRRVSRRWRITVDLAGGGDAWPASRRPDLRAIFALKAEDWPGSTLAVTARPSVVLGLSDGTSLQAGLIAGLRGSDALGCQRVALAGVLTPARLPPARGRASVPPCRTAQDPSAPPMTKPARWPGR